MKRLLTFVMALCLLCSLAVPFDASAAIPLDQSIDGLNNTSLVILPAGNTGTNYPKGKIVTDNYTEGDGSLYSNWPAPASGSLAGTQNGINISLVGVGGSTGLNIAAATYVSFDLYLHGVSFTSGKDALLRFGSQASWNSTDVGSVYITDQAKNMKEGWNHFTVPLPASWNHTSVKNIWIAFDNSCTAVTLTANDAYVLLDDVRLLTDEGKAINDVRNQAKPVIAAIAKAYATSAKADITAARNAYNSLSAAAKAYVTNLDKLEAAAASFNKQFRSMDVVASVNGGNGTQNRVTEATNYVEGSGAIKWQYTAASSGLFWYVYCDNHTTDTVGMDITGAEYITFDFYVSDASAWTLAGDTRINFRDSTDGWNAKAGQVTATNMNNTFKAMKTGWNHVAMPLDRSAATVNNVWAFRMYFASGTAPSGFYTMIDDIRFVSASYINSQHYADTIAAKDVAAKIGALSNSASASQVYSVQNAYFALTDAQRPLVANAARLNTLVTNLSATSVNIQYRHLNNAERTSQEAATTTETTTMRVEGTGAAKFVHAVDRTNGLYWYVYCESSAASTGTNIAGATHITFDFYVSDPSKWSIGTADMRLSVRNVASTTWDNSCTQVSAANMKTAFSNVKQGWNHIVMPLESLLTNDAFAFRMYMTGGSAKQGFYTIIDDVRFVNRTYLASADYADRIAAKKVSGLISQLTSQSGSPQISAARTAYNALTTTQQGYVCNYDWLTAYEAGNAPAGSAQQTFQTIPSSHLGNLAGYAKGEFSLAVLSDLHYAVNWNSQQKDIYFNSMKYILDRADSENTLMTLQLGDMTSGNRYAEWLTVREGFQMLVDGGMPYATAIGNHDIGSNANAAYNAFLPYSEQVAENPYLAGAKEEGKTDNLYYTFKVNGVKYMVLVLACYPKDAVLSWADSVVKAHSDYNVILMTHSYLQMKNGTLGYTEEVEALAAGFKGINVWNNLIKGNPNIFMTFSAHNSYPEPGKNGVGLLTSKNDAGRNVYQFLVPDPQNYENTYGGLGSLFMLRFSNAGKTVTGEYIATRYNKDFIGYGTNNFSITLDPIPDYTAMAKAVDDKIAALPATITLNNESAVAAARSAYNALSSEAKAKVTKLSVLTAAETKIADLKAAKTVQDKIAALPSTIALTNESAVTAARSAYNALTSTQKSYVTNLSKLTAAETTITNLKAAKTVQDKIAALPSTITLTNESAVTAARSAYNALTSTQKGYVTNLSVLTAAETKIADLKAAKSVQDKIAALPTTITLSHKSSVTAARSAYNALTATQKGYVTNLSVLTTAESTIAKLEQTEADKAAAATVQSQIAALNVQSLSDQSAVTAARSAYNALTSAQKAYVTNLSVLTAAETKIADLQAAKSVQDKIAALPSTITLSDKSNVTAARSAYNALTSTQKGYVTNLSKLTAAETTIANLEATAADQAAAAIVQSKIAALNVQSLSDESAVTAARSAYNALTSTQKGYVTNLSVLTAAETKIADMKAAKSVQDTIAALPATITLSDKSAVTAARSAYNALTSTQAGYVTNLSKLTAAETTIANLEQVEADKAAAATVQSQIAALKVQSLSDESAVTAACSAYNALTSAQKAYVTNLSVLTAAEAKIVDMKAAKSVQDRISVLPATITLSHKSSVTAARSAYDALTDAQKAYVTNISKLTAAEQTILELEQAELDQEAAQVVVYQIDALNVQSLDDESAVVAAREAYNALTSAQKAYVTNLEKLQQAEAKIVELKAQADQEALDKAAAKLVTDQIDALNVESLEDESAVVAARTAYNALTSAQKTYVTNLAKLEQAEAKIVELKAQADQEAKDKAAAKTVADQIDALNVQSVNDEAAVVAAREAYNALTSAQKAYVANLEKLQQAEAKIVELKAQADQEALDKTAAKLVTDQIDALNVESLDDESVVVAARTAYNALTSAQKAYVTNLEKLVAAETKIADLKAEKEAQEAADQAAAQAVTDTIADLNVDSLDDEADVVAAREAYDALTDTQKDLVTNLALLKTAEQTIEQLKADYEAQIEADKMLAQIVADQIDALNVQSLSNEPAVVAARAAYERLTDAQKGYVTNLAKLEQAEATIADLKAQAEKEAADKAAAKVVADQIDALNVQSLDDEPAVVAARDAYDALTADQKAYVTNLDKLEAAEQTIADLKNVVPPVEILYGDVDGDGNVTAADALEVLKAVVGKATLTEEQTKAADTDGNGKVEATDALNILKKVVNKIDKFPVEG